jgi:hypothetical protein
LAGKQKAACPSYGVVIGTDRKVRSGNKKGGNVMSQAHKVSSTILILFLLFSHNSFGQSCPPCTAEITARDQAQGAVNSAQDTVNYLQQQFNACMAFPGSDCNMIAAQLLVAEQLLASKQAALDTAQQVLDSCLARSAPVCKKCQDGQIVNDDSQDPGTCQKCENGAVANDDSEDPGMCQKCQNGSVANDDSESCDDFDPCTAGDHCSGGACVGTPIENPSPDSPECQ